MGKTICVGQGLYGESVYIQLSFAVNIKSLLNMCFKRTLYVCVCIHKNHIYSNIYLKGVCLYKPRLKVIPSSCNLCLPV